MIATGQDSGTLRPQIFPTAILITILLDGGDEMQSNLNNSSNSNTDITELDIEAAVALDEAKNNYRKIVRAGIAKWVKDFQNGSIEVKTVDDLKKLIEMDIDLLKDDL